MSNIRASSVEATVALSDKMLRRVQRQRAKLQKKVSDGRCPVCKRKFTDCSCDPRLIEAALRDMTLKEEKRLERIHAEKDRRLAKRRGCDRVARDLELAGGMVGDGRFVGGIGDFVLEPSDEAPQAVESDYDLIMVDATASHA